VQRQRLQLEDQRQLASHSKAWQVPHERPSTDVELVPGSHSPMPVHALAAPQRHVSEQVRLRVPHIGHGSVSVAPGSHSPAPMHALSGPQVHESRHVVTRVPHIGHGASRRSPGKHSQATHTPDAQRAPLSQPLVPGQQL